MLHCVAVISMFPAAESRLSAASSALGTATVFRDLDWAHPIFEIKGTKH